MDEHDARKLSPEAQADLRKRVVRAVLSGELGKSAASRAFAVSRTSVHHWVEAFVEGGEAALEPKPLGPAPGSVTRAPPAAEVVPLIRDHTPRDLGLPYDLWTREAVRVLLRERFGVEAAIRSVGRYLGQWGLTPQKPQRRAYEQDPQAVERWREVEYPAIRRRAQQQGAQVHWGDQMGLRSDHQTGTSYAPRGQTPVVRGTGQRFSCNVMSTLTNHGKLRFMVFQRRFTTEVLLEFLHRLLRSVDRKVFLIVDRHPVHKAKKVERWLAERSDRIEVFFLPGYAPELNPDEQLNQDVKSNAVGRRRPANPQQMIHRVRTYLKSTQRQPELVQNYFQADSVTYAAH